ncbi:MAG: hypothetical protein HYW37_01605 [Candidatus Colwellbacteria bacterium]|nr:hypothetical protein [Candidatus Colwellbacteria bacterium]
MTKFTIKAGLVSLTTAVSALFSKAALAAATTPPNVNITGKEQFLNALDSIINFAFVLFFTVAGFFFLWAAFDYLTAAGDEEKLKSAKNRLIYGIIAVILAAIAKSLPTFIPTFIQ